MEAGVIGVVEVSHLDLIRAVEESGERSRCERRVNGVVRVRKKSPLQLSVA